MMKITMICRMKNPNQCIGSIGSNQNLLKFLQSDSGILGNLDFSKKVKKIKILDNCSAIMISTFFFIVKPLQAMIRKRCCLNTTYYCLADRRPMYGLQFTVSHFYNTSKIRFKPLQIVRIINRSEFRHLIIFL